MTKFYNTKGKKMKDFIFAVVLAVVVLAIAFGVGALFSEIRPITQPDPTPTQETNYGVGCLEDEHQATVITANPCLQDPYVMRLYKQGSAT
jgi:hypothetical protein